MSTDTSISGIQFGITSRAVVDSEYALVTINGEERWFTKKYCGVDGELATRVSYHDKFIKNRVERGDGSCKYTEHTFRNHPHTTKHTIETMLCW